MLSPDTISIDAITPYKIIINTNDKIKVSAISAIVFLKSFIFTGAYSPRLAQANTDSYDNIIGKSD